jgi:hypothetical protein
MKKGFLVALSILFSLYSIAQTAQKRVEPAKVKPVVYGQLTLTAPTNKMGYIVAYDSTGKEAWNVRIYKVHYNVFLEKDVQGVYINNIQLRKDNLLIRNDIDEDYLLDLKTLGVTKLSF